MEDALFVGGVETVGELNADVNGARNGKGADGDEIVEGLAFEQLHGDKGAAIVFFDGVNGANAGMIERGRGAGFAKEAFESLFVAMRGLRKKFQGDTAAELGVFSFVDDTHAAFAELAEDAVMGDGFVEHRQGMKIRMVDGRGIGVNSYCVVQCSAFPPSKILRGDFGLMFCDNKYQSLQNKAGFTRKIYRSNRAAYATIVLAATLLLMVCEPGARAQAQDVTSKLSGFDSYMEQVLKDWNTPGIGVGIVVNDKLVFAKGYGYR